MRTTISLVIYALAVSCSVDQTPLVASDVEIRSPMPGMQMSAGYLTLSNNTTQPITITHVASPQFESVEMHESVLEDGVSRMYELAELKILPETSVIFERGGKHLMLMRPVDDSDVVTLEFYAGKAIVLTVNAPLTD